ncbi:MAG: hypothetical protein BIFFINMI_00939 [Phycisphaerae bacterium]|nr:hypothetical protein [Phycisphaerae bacterium]
MTTQATHQTIPAGTSSRGQYGSFSDLLAQHAAVRDPAKAQAYVEKRITYRVERLLRKFQIPETDQPDLEQEFWLSLVTAIGSYVPERTRWQTFICRVLDRKYQHMVRQFINDREYPVLTPSPISDIRTNLDESIADPDWAGDDPFEREDLRMDVEAALSRMPPRLAAIAGMLKTYEPAEVARRLGTSGAAVTRAIKQIRRHLESAGITGPCAAA